MIEESFARVFINQWMVFPIVTLFLIVLAHAGYRSGASFRRRNTEVAENHSGSVQGAVLGLLGLLLGFSFAMAVAHYDERCKLIVDEANSIRNSWLRADLLPAPHNQEIKSLLKEYTKLKMQEFDDAEDVELVARVRGEAEQVRHELWARTTVATRESPTPVTVCFVTSLNETIDFDVTRKAAIGSRIPGVVWILLLVVAGCGAWSSGYGSGAGGLRSIFNQYVFPALIGIVITLVADLDRPTKGLVSMDQEPFEDLLDQM
jgi:hypothetical protein